MPLLLFTDFGCRVGPDGSCQLLRHYCTEAFRKPIDQTGADLRERLGIAGSGVIACGLAVAAAGQGEVLLWARSDGSAERARARVTKTCAKLDGFDPDRVRIVTNLDELAGATFLVEAVVEHHGSKTAVLADLGVLARHAGAGAVLATTTSSLSINELARASGLPERFVAFHPFNPVPKMQLVELAFPPEANEDTRARARKLCRELGKTAVEVPDIPGFVVNRLLFPYLFRAVDLLSETGMAPEDIDRCMTLGAGMPMGPIALLDYVGLDVSKAIGESIGARVPDRLVELVATGSLGRKTGIGFYRYD
ncbi:MAG: 3-hydroxyacyl-CoA dehydrogenase family protein [Solirubrobacterales bacterium]|nr:3-hydroxyacyl-CoA dehydrogenase family protein [Solirubrobacterales bacterium]